MRPVKAPMINKEVYNILPTGVGTHLPTKKLHSYKTLAIHGLKNFYQIVFATLSHETQGQV